VVIFLLMTRGLLFLDGNRGVFIVWLSVVFGGVI
jgi:hypothetical protein